MSTQSKPWSIRAAFRATWERLVPAPTIPLRVDRNTDPSTGISFLMLVDPAGHPVDGAAGIDALARNFRHRDRVVRVGRAVRTVLDLIAEHGGRWTPGRGFAIRDEDYPDAARALETVGDVSVADAPGAKAWKVDSRPMEPCEVVDLEGDESLRRRIGFTDADGLIIVPPADVEAAGRRTWLRNENGWMRRPRETAKEIAEIAKEAAVPTLSGDDVPHFLAKQLLEARKDGRRIILLPRAAAARVLVGDWMPHAHVDAQDSRISIDLSVRANGMDVPWKAISGAEGRRYVRVDRDTWIRNDSGARKRTEEALREIPGLKETSSRGGFEAPAYALPVVQEMFAAFGTIDLTSSAQRLFETLNDFSRIESVPVPRGIRAELRPYQRKGLDWLCFLRRFGFGGVLADDMGLGKTLQTCSALAAAAEAGQTEASLVVCPASVVAVWEQEILRWCTELQPIVLRTGERTRYLEAPRPNTIAIASYQAVARASELFQRPVWNYLVLDEAHRVKNHTTVAAKACKGILARHKLAVTGTPIQNRLKELWSLYDSIMPGYLGDAGTFTRKFATPIEKEKSEEAAEQLRRRVDPFKLRRLKTQVATDLPPITRQLRQVELLDDQRRMYNLLRDELRVPEVLRELRGHGSPLMGLEKLLRLRQVCAHPALVHSSAALRGTSAKLEATQEILEESLEEGHKVLVFTQWTKMASLILRLLGEEKIDSVYLDGAVPVAARADLVRRFQEPNGPPVMVISLLAGGEGITLTQADTVIMYDRWWNPAVEEQAIARAYRIGQKRPVTAYILEATDTIEQRLARLLSGKQALAEDLVRIDDFEKRITREQLIAVLEEELAGADSRLPAGV